MKQIRHQAITVVEIQHQVQQLAEAMSDVPVKLDQLTLNTDELKSDMKVVMAAVTETIFKVKENDTAITQLQRAA